jgi:hypothetical protein
MSFPTLTLSSSVTTTEGGRSSSGTFTANLTGNADGTVAGTWSFAGTYSDVGPIGGTSGGIGLSGTVIGTGSANGPWVLTFAGAPASQGGTLTYANGQYSLSGNVGFYVDYSVIGGYDYEYTYHDLINVNASLSVAAAAPAGAATAGADTLTGSAGADTLNGLGGNDALDGGAGIDTAVFSGAHAGYTITRTNAGFTVSGADGTDTLVNVERLQFGDAKVAIDINGNGGMAYRLYQAAFDRTPDIGGLGFQMNALDTGLTIAQVAGNFIASPEFQTTYGPNISTSAFVTLLYQNVLNRAPDDAGLAFHVNNLDHTGLSRADVLVQFSESPENQANVIGTIQSGMVYTL